MIIQASMLQVSIWLMIKQKGDRPAIDANDDGDGSDAPDHDDHVSTLRW